MPNQDQHFLDLAARAAARAVGYVEPNPMVGAVIVKDGDVIGIGHHKRFGGLHAEREAIRDCAERGNHPAGATIYVTLEPCSHHGKQPPCTEAITEAGIDEVVIARRDPHPTSTGGAERLGAQGVRVRFADVTGAPVDMSDPFVKRVRTGRPWVIAKWAQTIDGRIATRTGESQWISCPSSRRLVHKWRARVDGILTGIGTVLADDPRLTSRDVRIRRNARRIVIDPDLRIPANCKLLATLDFAPVTIACSTAAAAGEDAQRLRDRAVEIVPLPESASRLDLDPLFAHLVDTHEATNILTEAGPGLIGSLLDQDLVDECRVFVAPMVMADDEALAPAGGRNAPRLADAVGFRFGRLKRCGNDALLVARRHMEA